MAVTAARVTSPPQTKTKPHRPGKSGAATAGLRDLAIAHPFGPVQARLTVGPTNDRYEQEADAVAERVMRMVDPALTPQDATPVGGIQRIQRLCHACEEEVQSRPEDEEPTVLRKAEPGTTDEEAEPAIISGLEGLRSAGEPLAPATRAFFEPRFGRDFQDVRVHTGAQPAALAHGLSARAFTLGRDIVFGQGRDALSTPAGMKLLAHELTHVVQQGGAPAGSGLDQAALAGGVTSPPAETIQRAGDPAAIPPGGLPCPTDLTPGAPVGTSLLFTTGGSTITPAHTALLTTFVATWLAGGGTDNITVHGFASPIGDQGPNWVLSCDRAVAVRAELIRLGIPAVRIELLAHGESTDFGAGDAPNQRAVVSTSAPGLITLPIVVGTLTASDNFAGRSVSRFGVGEIINLNFLSLPATTAADLGGLSWTLAAGGGLLVAGPNDGTGTYTAPATAGPVRLELRVAAGATAGRLISAHSIAIVIPSDVRMTDVPGTAPDFAGAIVPGTWGAGFQANPFIEPRDVSFQVVMFGEGTVAGVVTPTGSFLSARHGTVHPVGGLAPAGPGNATTGTPVLAVDRIATAGGVAPRTVLGVQICGVSDFLWAIPWEFSVTGPRTPFTTANHHVTSTTFCHATIEKARAGPFCRAIDGTVC